MVADQLAGPRAITLIRAKVDLPAAPADRDVLRELALQIRWEGETSPSVWVPFGDFFGTAPGANPYRAFPCGLTEDGWWYANWYMPFGQSAEVKVINEGKVDRKLKLEIYHEPLPGEVAQFGRFHAKWHRDQFLPAEPERAIDWPMLKTTGRGRFVGVMLHIWSPRGGWWGEGDEKFFVDGEKFPSTFGTGSEDYFGYAWSSPTLFFHPLHNQTFNSGNCKGHISVNRFHIADQIPFQKSFEADIEKYYANAKPAFYASTVYWYLAPDGRDPYQVVPVAERANYYVQPVVQKVPGSDRRGSTKGACQDRRQSAGPGYDGLWRPVERRRTSVVDGCPARRSARTCPARRSYWPVRCLSPTDQSTGLRNRAAMARWEEARRSD
ncbi:MAG: glycoside hydrolase family 172 protein [Verrucomicrobiota bacterium]